eukprot:g19798.t1
MSLPASPLADNGEDSQALTFLQDVCAKRFTPDGRKSNSQADALKGIRQFVELHASGGLSSAAIAAAIKAATIGDALGFFLKAQNTLLVVRKLDGKTAQVCSWTVQRSVAEVMDHENLLQPLPERGITCPWTSVASTAFADLLQELARDAQGEVGSDGSGNINSTRARGTNRSAHSMPCSLYAHEFLMRILPGGRAFEDPPVAGRRSKMNREPPLCLAKKVRDQCRRDCAKKDKHWRRAPAWFAFKSFAHFVCLNAWPAPAPPTGSDVGPEEQNERSVGHMLYKCVMQIIIADCLAAAAGIGPALLKKTTLRLSSFREGARKLERRLHKLRSMSESASPSDSSFVKGKLLPAAETGTRAALTAEKKFVESIEDEQRANLVPKLGFSVSNASIAAARRHGLKNSLPTIESLAKELLAVPPKSAAIADPDPGPQRVRLTSTKGVDQNACIDKLRQLLEKAQRGGDKSWRIRAAALFDVDQYILLAWREGSTNFNAEKLLKLCTTYVNEALEFYERCFRARSEAVLVFFTMVMMLDRHACAKHELLQEHPLKIPPEWLHDLYLDSREYRTHLASVEKYLRDRRAGTMEPFGAARKMGSQSFPVRFAASDTGMQKAKAKVLADCAKEQEAKRIEVRNQLQKYHEKERSRNAHACRCHELNEKDYQDSLRIYNHQHGSSYGYSYGRTNTYPRKRYGTHSSCVRCRYQKEMDGITVTPYVKTLPDSEVVRNAIIFEKGKPISIAVLEEALKFFADKSLFKRQYESPPVFEYASHFISWAAVHSVGYKNRNYSSLISFSAPTLGTTVPIPASGGARHCTNHENSFIIQNTANAVWGFGSPLSCSNNGGWTKFLSIADWPWQNVRKNLLTASGMLPPSTKRYGGARKFLMTCEHRENEVITAQSDAARGATAAESVELREFIDYGMLRAGHSLQLLRLLSALEQRSLDLNNHDVCLLIAASLWQCCPPLTQSSQIAGNKPLLEKIEKMETPTMFREASALLSSDAFTAALLAEATAILETARANWDKQNALLVVSMIAKAVFEHTHSSESFKLLQSAREVAIEWTRSLAETAAVTIKDELAQKLREKILHIACFGCCTFTSEEFDPAGKSGTAAASGGVEKSVVDWLFLRATFHDYSSAADLRECAWASRHIFMAEKTALMITPALCRLLESDSKPLEQFLELYWPGACDTTLGQVLTKWKPNGDQPESDGFYKSTIRNAEGKVLRVVHVSVTNGQFLVDGKPCSRLSKTILDSSIYRRTFGKAAFLVQPFDSRTVKTRCQVGGAFYLFREPTGTHDFPVIIEEREGRRSILVPSDAFTAPDQHTSTKSEDGDDSDGDDENIADAHHDKSPAVSPSDEVSTYAHDLPVDLVENYSHWLSIPQSTASEESRPMFLVDKVMGMKSGTITEPEAIITIQKVKDRCLSKPEGAELGGHKGISVDSANAALLQIKQRFAQKRAAARKPKPGVKLVVNAQPRSESEVVKFGLISFRKPRYHDKDFSGEGDFVLDLSTRFCRDRRRGDDMACLLDVHSSCVREMFTGFLHRLTPVAHIHAYASAAKTDSHDKLLSAWEASTSKSTGAVVILPRLQNLRFDIEQIISEQVVVVGGQGSCEMNMKMKKRVSLAASPQKGSPGKPGGKQGSGSSSAAAPGVLAAAPPTDRALRQFGAGSPMPNSNKHGQELSPRGCGSAGATQRNRIRTPEFPDYVVAADQSMGTLHGLSAGILLQPEGGLADCAHKMFIVPFSTRLRRVSTGAVQVDLSEVEQPSYFTYELRSDLRCLQPQKEQIASLYLSLLHAVTSGVTSDRFLEVPGYREALKLLQSGRVRGNLVPSMHEDQMKSIAGLKRMLKCLHLLGFLSPNRSSFPNDGRFEYNRLETQALEPLAASNLYSFLVRDVAEDLSSALIYAGRNSLR